MNHGTSTVEPEKIALQVIDIRDKTTGWTFHVQKEDKLTVLFTPLEKIMGGNSSHYLYSVYIIINHLHHNNICVYTHTHPKSHTPRQMFSEVRKHQGYPLVGPYQNSILLRDDIRRHHLSMWCHTTCGTLSY